MANPNPKNQFKKGNKTGKGHGRPKIPKEIVVARQDFTADELRIKLAKYLRMDPRSIKKTMADIKADKGEHVDAVDLVIMQIIWKAIAEGDPRRLDFLLDRLIGRVKEVKEVSITHALEEKPDSEVLELGKEAIRVLEGST